MANIFGGPRTKAGKAIAARNATTHGLFSRNVVLPHLGEDPRGYQEMLDLLQVQINPRTAAELYYVERVAEATWQMRRLARWEAQIWENDGLDEDQRLTKIERVQKLQITLGRRVDRAFQMLARTLPQLTTARVRENFLHARGLTNISCKQDSWQGRTLEREVREHIYSLSLPEMDLTILDNAPAPPEAPIVPEAPAPAEHENSQNEPPAAGAPADRIAGTPVGASVPTSSPPSEPQCTPENSQNQPRIPLAEQVRLAFAEDPYCTVQIGPGGLTTIPSRRARADRAREL